MTREENYSFKDLNMPITAREFTADIEDFVHIPSVCLRINEMANNPRFSAIDMANEIAKDPMTMARVMRMANSPYYHFPAKVDNLTRAITIIGTQDLQDMLLMVALRAATEQSQPTLIDLDNYWKHSLFVGLMAKRLAGMISTPVLGRDRLFVAGVLHEFGRIVFAQKIPELFKVMLNRAMNQQEPFYEIERLVFGIDHTEISLEIMNRWLYPARLSTVIRYQHHPVRAGDQRLEASLLLLADHASAIAGLPGIGEDGQTEELARAMQFCGVTERLMDDAIELARNDYFELLPVFMQRKTA
ncbi:MAG: HDOD domain-containing protein [Gammaproteobacteria bacterium]|nr:HDOD domain-containing protein [Gammaproteobacteria bacterium]